MNTKRSYKNLHNEDEQDDSSIQSPRNETTILPRVIDISVDVNVDIQKNNVIHYNDLDDEPVDIISSSSSSSYNVSFTDSSTNQDMDSLIREGEDGSTSSSLNDNLEDVIKQKNIYLNQPKAIEPTKSKPSKKFVSPIEMMKKVPKVEPIHMSTV